MPVVYPTGWPPRDSVSVTMPPQRDSAAPWWACRARLCSLDEVLAWFLLCRSGLATLCRAQRWCGISCPWVTPRSARKPSGALFMLWDTLRA